MLDFSIPRLAGYLPHSLCDFPGHVSAVLFLSGCNLRCPTCHNKPLAFDEFCPSIDFQSVFSDLIANKRKGWLDRVVVTGGEPCMSEDILPLLYMLGHEGFKIKVDSNGMRPEIVSQILHLDFVEMIAIDVKSPWSKYSLATGGLVSAEMAMENLNRIFSMAKEQAKRFYFRCTKVPFLTDEDVLEVQSYLPGGMRLAVQGYRVG